MQWDALSGKLLKRIDIGYLTDDELEMSPNGKYLLAGVEREKQDYIRSNPPVCAGNAI